MEFIWGRNIFQKFLNEPMQRESDLEGSNIFIENSMSPLRANLCVPKTWVLQVLGKWT